MFFLNLGVFCFTSCFTCVYMSVKMSLAPLCSGLGVAVVWNLGSCTTFFSVLQHVHVCYRGIPSLVYAAYSSGKTLRPQKNNTYRHFAQAGGIRNPIFLTFLDVLSELTVGRPLLEVAEPSQGLLHHFSCFF